MAWHQYAMAFIYITAGINHFINPKMYIKIIPPYIPRANLVNKVSGFFEILFGVMLCFKQTTAVAVVGIVVLLIGFFATHFYMLQNKKASLNMPKWFLLARLPLQIGLIYWAFQYL